MEALRERAHEDIPVLAVDLEALVQAHGGGVGERLEGLVALSVQLQEPAVGLVTAAERNDILLRQPA